MKKQLIIGWGIQVRDWYIHNDFVNYLDEKAKSAGTGTNKWIYKDKSVNYEISFVYTKDEFKKALDIPRAIVVYDGHSRFGQGPAFGPHGVPECPDKDKYSTNPWEDFLHMGWDVISLPCIDEILQHCTNPVEISTLNPPKDFFAAGSVKNAIENAKQLPKDKCNQAGSWRALYKCYRSIAEQKNGRGEQSLIDFHYYKAHYPPRGKSDVPNEFDTLIEVGSKDLAELSLKCDVLYMNSCSSKWHFYSALKRRKNEAKSKCVFYAANKLVGDVPTSQAFTAQLLAGLDPWLKRDAKIILKAVNMIRGSGDIQLLP